jgi:Zn-dependent peptidase ImmA (M78 family)
LSKFRLLMARQCGEKIAADRGFTAFPVDPFAIAASEDILVEAKDPDRKGMSGCIVFTDDGAGIIYATDIRSEGFRRFTVAHELGHYFLEGHPEEILKTGRVHFSRAGFVQGGISIEIEADHFASGLLMPTRLTREALYQAPIGLAGMQHLATVAEASLTAAAIRTAECAPYPVAIIVSEREQVSYGFLSESFKKLGKLRFLRKGDALPHTGTRAFNAVPDNIRLGRSVCQQSNLAAWFGASEDITLDEEIIGLGSYGYTLTVLSSEALTDDPDEEEDEESDLIASWAVKFR